MDKFRLFFLGTVEYVTDDSGLDFGGEKTREKNRNPTITPAGESAYARYDTARRAGVAQFQP